MKSNAGEKITPYEVTSLFQKPFSNAASVGKGEAGFKVTGIYPIDPSVFKEEYFLAADALNDLDDNGIDTNLNEDIAPASTIPRSDQEQAGSSKKSCYSEHKGSAISSDFKAKTDSKLQC